MPSRQSNPKRQMTGRSGARRITERRSLRRAVRPSTLEPLVEIASDRLHQRLDLAVEEMVGAGNDLLLDDDAFLRLQLLDQVGDVARRHHRVLVAVDDQARRRARQEREVIKVCGRGNGDKALDLRPPHQKLHANPRTEREAGGPAATRLGIIDAKLSASSAGLCLAR